MRSWLARQLLTRLMARLNAGDPSRCCGSTTATSASASRATAPGRPTCAARTSSAGGCSASSDSGLQIFADEVVVRGWPWDTTLAVRGTDHLVTPAGERVYANRYVIWGRMRWGLLREYEVYEDTQASKALDDHLPALVAP